MAKYTVAVCDDEKEDLSFIVRKITEYDTHQLFEIKTYTDRCYLVNMEHILYTSSDEIMRSNGAKLPISRRKRQEFNQAFNTYLGR